MNGKNDGIFEGGFGNKCLHVKRSLTNDEKSIIAVCSDISRVKNLESTSKRIKDLYFSSVAHELRTPLNSILPIVRLIIELYSS
jgi:signal transduction histidine kinase